MAVCIHRDWLVGVEALDGTLLMLPVMLSVGERYGYVRERARRVRRLRAGALLAASNTAFVASPGYRMSVKQMGTCFGAR